MNAVRLGIIGIGNQGSHYARSLTLGDWPDTGLTLCAVADINPARLDWAQKTLPASVARFGDALEMLDSGLVEACIVSVPHYDHPKYVMACMERGIHVMCEKPAGVYTEQVREMNACAEKHPEVVFGMMFNQRTNCVYRKMRELIQSGKFGRVRRANWLITDWYRSQYYYDSGDWRATWAGEGGGVLLNQCPHQLDLFQWILGMPEKVQAFMRFGAFHDIEVEDDVTALMTWPDGHTGVFITSTGDPHGSNRFEVQMDGAQLVVEGDQLRVYELEALEQDWMKTNRQPFGSVPGKGYIAETDGENPQHRGVLTRWAAAIREGTPLVASGAEGINGLTLSNAMHLSAFTGEPVTLPLDEKRYKEELMKRVATSRRKTGGSAVVADTSNTFAGAK